MIGKMGKLFAGFWPDYKLAVLLMLAVFVLAAIESNLTIATSLVAGMMFLFSVFALAMDLADNLFTWQLPARITALRAFLVIGLASALILFGQKNLVFYGAMVGSVFGVLMAIRIHFLLGGRK